MRYTRSGLYKELQPSIASPLLNEAAQPTHRHRHQGRHPRRGRGGSRSVCARSGSVFVCVRASSLAKLLADSSALQESAQTPSDDDSDIAYVNVSIRASKQMPDFRKFPLSKGRATHDDGLEAHFQSRRSTVCLIILPFRYHSAKFKFCERRSVRLSVTCCCV